MFTSPNKKSEVQNLSLVIREYAQACLSRMPSSPKKKKKKKKKKPSPQSEEFKPTSWRSGHEEPNLFLYFQSPTNTVNFRLRFHKGFEEGL